MTDDDRTPNTEQTPNNSLATSRLRRYWRDNRDSSRLFAFAMAGIAALFIIGIVVAFNSARVDNLADQQAAPTTTTAPQAETTGSGSADRPALPTPQNTKP